MAISTTRFALIGIAGYAAPRHLLAMRECRGQLAAAFDISDSVGIMDQHFPDARFFVEFERFDRHIDLLRRSGQPIDYLSICSPNHLHDAHARFALRSGVHAICEHPLVLDPEDVAGLESLERESGRKVSSIMQLRLHPSILALRERVQASPAEHVFDVDLTYITARGRWYHVSWKGDEHRSGGIATTIGAHFFDMLEHVFGRAKSSVVHHRALDIAAGELMLERARVRWLLSINRRDLPESTPPGRTTHRSITVDKQEFEFSEGFAGLYEESYKRILAGEGFGLAEVLPAIETVATIRRAPIEPSKGEQHPLLGRALGLTERYRHGWPL